MTGLSILILFCLLYHSVPSQVIVSRTLMKKQMMMSVATKVAIQLNCKMGGEVWALDIPVSTLSVDIVHTLYWKHVSFSHNGSIIYIK